MNMTRQSVYLEPEKRDKVAPLLRRHGMTLSSFVRKSIEDYLERHESQATPPEGPEAA